ncbi:hypothetical protein J6590_060491 [Homalodisca vitripennis]|nr:hypothetical protein J6590_060491 [Homalodisca vitripennis]
MNTYMILYTPHSSGCVWILYVVIKVIAQWKIVRFITCRDRPTFATQRLFVVGYMIQAGHRPRPTQGPYTRATAHRAPRRPVSHCVTLAVAVAS